MYQVKVELGVIHFQVYLYICSLNNNDNSDSQCNSHTCEVKNCIHNANTCCNLQSINISGTRSQICVQTKCSNFDFK